MNIKTNQEKAAEAFFSFETLKNLGVGAAGAFALYYPLAYSTNELNNTPYIQSIRLLTASTPLLLSLMGVGIRVLASTDIQIRRQQ